MLERTGEHVQKIIDEYHEDLLNQRNKSENDDIYNSDEDEENSIDYKAMEEEYNVHAPKLLRSYNDTDSVFSGDDGSPEQGPLDGEKPDYDVLRLRGFSEKEIKKQELSDMRRRIEEFERIHFNNDEEDSDLDTSNRKESAKHKREQKTRKQENNKRRWQRKNADNKSKVKS